MCWWFVFVTHVLREVQQRKHKENILLSVLQRAVAEVAVVSPVTQRELQGEGLEVSADVGPRIRLAGLSADAEGAADTGPVDLFQQLQRGGQELTVVAIFLNTHTHTPVKGQWGCIDYYHLSMNVFIIN